MTPGKQIALSWLACGLCVISVAAQAQAQPSSGEPNAGGVLFADYLQAVEANSLDLQAQRQNVTAAQAGVSIAGVRPDPAVTAGIGSKELYGPNKPNTATSATAGLSVTIETAGKRDARINLARSGVDLSQAALSGFVRDLYGQSAAAFVEACRARDVLRRKESSLKAFRDLVTANETRFRMGDIGGLELRQSKVESQRFETDVRTAAADAQAAMIGLWGPLGKRFDQVFTATSVDCQLKTNPLQDSLDTLVDKALAQRDDIRIARQGLENARRGSDLARANRWVDPTVNIGVTNTPALNAAYDSGGNQTVFPTTRSVALGLTVSIPIPVSRLQRGELIQAETLVTQAELQLRSTIIRAEGDVRATFAQYEAASANAQDYAQRVLADSERVLEGVRISYRRGSASLLELLNAQRTADDVYLGYLQASADLANATVKLQLSTGTRPEL